MKIVVGHLLIGYLKIFCRHQVRSFDVKGNKYKRY